MNTLLAMWIALLPAELARLLVGVVGPAIRGLKLNVAELVDLLNFVSTKLKGATPVYTVVGQYTVQDVEDIVTAICNSLQPLLTGQGSTRSDAQYSVMAEKLAARLAVRYPTV